MKQDQFLDVVDRDEAERRFRAVLDLRPLASEQLYLSEALGRILADDIEAPIDVPGFDRSNVDGFAVRAEETFGASEDVTRRFHLTAEIIPTGVSSPRPIEAGWATAIATGAMVPRGANAVVMIEDTDLIGDELIVRRPVTPGANISFAGTDIGRGEIVLWRGDLLTSRETGVLASLGLSCVPVVRRPRVAIISTGDELLAPGASPAPGMIYDSNATVLSDAVREIGGEPVGFGIVADDRAALDEVLNRALACDVVLLSGGTSKGAGDVSYRAVASLGQPGIVAHGVALKPGKPLCLAAVASGDNRRLIPVVVLPGFPTSAIFTFHEFVAPVIRLLGGRRNTKTETVAARLPLRVNSERGRTEYLLINLVARPDNADEIASPTGDMNHSHMKYAAYPMEKGSGSVTAFARADGFVIIPRQQEYLEAGEDVQVHRLAKDVAPADCVVIGSHCLGLDYLLGKLREHGFSAKFLSVGSNGGIMAARRGECDLAGIHLLDPESNTYNRPYLDQTLMLLPGYGRLQGILYRRGDARFEGASVQDALARALGDPNCILINRNRGSGTRILVDQLLGAARPPGYLAESKSHTAVAAAIAQGRADWGVAIQNAAALANLEFLPLKAEQYDFVVPRIRVNRPAVLAFRSLLAAPESQQALERMGFTPAGLHG